MSLWSVGRRCGATLAEVEESFERADFVRTHVMRGTWHHVLAADLTDFLESHQAAERADAGHRQPDDRAVRRSTCTTARTS